MTSFSTIIAVSVFGRTSLSFSVFSGASLTGVTFPGFSSFSRLDTVLQSSHQFFEISPLRRTICLIKPGHFLFLFPRVLAPHFLHLLVTLLHCKTSLDSIVVIYILSYYLFHELLIICLKQYSIPGSILGVVSSPVTTISLLLHLESPLAKSLAALRHLLIQFKSCRSLICLPLYAGPHLLQRLVEAVPLLHVPDVLEQVAHLDIADQLEDLLGFDTALAGSTSSLGHMSSRVSPGRLGGSQEALEPLHVQLEPLQQLLGVAVLLNLEGPRLQQVQHVHGRFLARVVLST